jgi:hypothetical protein
MSLTGGGRLPSTFIGQKKIPSLSPPLSPSLPHSLTPYLSLPSSLSLSLPLPPSPLLSESP